jgi:hypothetical protein
MDCPLRWEGVPSVAVSSGGGAYRGSGVGDGASLCPFWQPSQPPARLGSGETGCDVVVAMAMSTTSLGKLVVTCFPLVIELSHLVARFVPVSMAQGLPSICFPVVPRRSGTDQRARTPMAVSSGPFCATGRAGRACPTWPRGVEGGCPGAAGYAGSAGCSLPATVRGFGGYTRGG